MSAASDERRRAMDFQMAAVMTEHKTILDNQRYISTQLTHQHDCLERLKTAVAAGTEVTEEVRELLAAFKVFGRIAKWGSVVGAAMFSLWHGITAALKFWK